MRHNAFSLSINVTEWSIRTSFLQSFEANIEILDSIPMELLLYRIIWVIIYKVKR